MFHGYVKEPDGSVNKQSNQKIEHQKTLKLQHELDTNMGQQS